MIFVMFFHDFYHVCVCDLVIYTNKLNSFNNQLLTHTGHNKGLQYFYKL